jgi:hypothetical protein
MIINHIYAHSTGVARDTTLESALDVTYRRKSLRVPMGDIASFCISEEARNPYSPDRLKPCQGL